MNIRTRCVVGGAFALVGGLAAVAGAEFRITNGTKNNLFDPGMGASHTPHMRLAAPEYGPPTFLFEMGGQDRPDPRTISNAIAAQPELVFNDRGLTDYTWQWGQFVDHDYTLSLDLSGEVNHTIPIPTGDKWFDPNNLGGVVMPFQRSSYEPTSSPREQVNVLTAWLDASNVYGSDAPRAEWLRSMVDGKLKVTPHVTGDLLPFNDGTQPNFGGPGPKFFVAGDIRVNEQVSLIAMHTLWVREHNRLAEAIAPAFDAANPGLTAQVRDELLYQRARSMVGALQQVITYNEFLPALLGDNPLPPYAGYNPSADGRVANLFAGAMFRVGHTMLSSTILRVDENGDVIPQGNMTLQNMFLRPDLITDEGGIEPILRGLAIPQMQEIDWFVVHDVRNMLFGPPGSGGLDLASLNIQRGRDHGLPDYNAARVALGLPALTSFSQITANPERAALLESVYGDINNVDPWIGALAEDHVPGTSVGETIRAAFIDQFGRSRDADRFFYLSPEDPADLAGTLSMLGLTMQDLDSTTLADVIRRNTTITSIHNYVFHLRITGDITGDGVVGFEDLSSVLNNYLLPGAAHTGDVNGDGMVDFADLNLVLTNFGQSI